MSVENLLERIYGPLAGTQVGALSWCVGVEEAHWPSDRLPMIGEAEGRRYLSVSDMRRAESLRAMFDADVDLYGQLVRRGHQMGLGVYASVRMNDNHFWSDAERRVKPLRPEEMASMERPHLTAFRKSHPEWGARRGSADLGGHIVEHGGAGDPRVHPATHRRGLRAGELGRRRARLAAPCLPPA